MSKNKLMEAAAEILASGKGKGAMPLEKPADSAVVDLGGPTPQNYKQDDDSAKIDATKAAKSATAPATKPSNASADTQNNPQGGKKTMGEEEVKDEEVIAEDQVDEAWKADKKKMKEDVDALFADDSTISEEFKTKVSTIFEARVNDRIAQIQEEIESEYAGMLEEAVKSIRDDLTEKVEIGRAHV